MKTPFPKQTDLANALGVPMPPAWAALMKIAHANSKTRPAMACYFEDALTLRFSGRCLRAWGARAKPDDGYTYTKTPPEFIELANMGVDGVTYGMVIRTPECPEDDPPIAEFSPMDSDPIFLLGKNAKEAIENLVAQGISFREEDEGNEEAVDAKKFALMMRQIEKSLGFKPSKKHAERQYDKNGDARPIPVKARKGYRYMETADGVGVHAPQAAFDHSKPAPKIRASTPLKALLKHATTALKSGFPATSLAVAKSAWWCHSAEASACESLAPVLADCYVALKRPDYAESPARLAKKAAETEAMLKAIGFKMPRAR